MRMKTSGCKELAINKLWWVGIEFKQERCHRHFSSDTSQQS